MPLRRSSCATVETSRAPVAPSGWPMRDRAAVDVHLVRAGCRDRGSDGITCAANASLNSTRSILSAAMPACLSAFFVDGIGPRPITCGFTPATPMPTMRASGVRPSFARLLLAHQQRSGDAVVGRARVAGGDDDLLAAEADHALHRLERAELLGGGVGANALVAVEEHDLAGLRSRPSCPARRRPDPRPRAGRSRPCRCPSRRRRRLAVALGRELRRAPRALRP